MYLEKKLKYGILYIKVGNERIYFIMTSEFFWSLLASIIKKTDITTTKEDQKGQKQTEFQINPNKNVNVKIIFIMS